MREKMTHRGSLVSDEFFIFQKNLKQSTQPLGVVCCEMLNTVACGGTFPPDSHGHC